MAASGSSCLNTSQPFLLPSAVTTLNPLDSRSILFCSSRSRSSSTNNIFLSAGIILINLYFRIYQLFIYSYRQFYFKCCSFTDFTLETYKTIMHFDNAIRNSKTKPSSFSYFFCCKERSKYFAKIFFLNPLPSIADFSNKIILLDIGFETKTFFAAFFHRFTCIIGKIDKHLLYLVFISFNNTFFVQDRKSVV